MMESVAIVALPEGPTFRLKNKDRDLEVAMSDMQTQSLTDIGEAAIKELLHSGVKGMKWGVRKDRGHEGERVKTKKLDKLDKQWEKQNTGIHGWVKVNNAVADRMNGGMIDKFNEEPRWKEAAAKGTFLDDNHPDTQEYFAAYEKLANRVWAEETVKLGSNPSGTKAYELREDAEGNPYGYLAPVNSEVKHAEGDVQSVMRIIRNSNGSIEGLVVEELELKHYGVKGMQWGVRKTEADGSPRQRGKIRRGMTKAGDASEAGQKITSNSNNRLKAVALPQENRDSVLGDVQAHMLGAALGMKKDPRFAGKDIKYDAPLRETYRKEMEKIAQDYYSKRLREEYTLLGLQVAETAVRAGYDYNKKRVAIKQAAANEATHADSGAHMYLDFEYDDQGFISEVEATEGELKHYGVKGMQWGVRKSDSAAGGPKDVTVTQKKPGTYAKAKGGQGHAITDDAAKALEARQKARVSTTDALTNKELQEAVNRMNLEVQYKRLEFESDRRSAGKRFVAGLLGAKRYNGEKLKYKDIHEEAGEAVANAYKEGQKVKKVVTGQ